MVDIAEHGGGNEPALGQGTTEPGSSAQAGGAVGVGPRDHPQNPLHGDFGHDRAHHRLGIERIPDVRRFDGGDELADDVVVDIVMYVEPGGQRAALPGQEGGTGVGRHGHGRMEVGVGEDDVG